MLNSYVNKIVKVKENGIVTIDEAKKQLNVEADFLDDDIFIGMLIESARGAAEDYTGIDIAITTNTLTFIRTSTNTIKINEAVFNSIESITAWVDNIDTLITDYEIQENRIDFVIHFDDTVTADKLIIVFKTGYTSSDLPSQTKSAILIKINDLYDLERTSFVVGSNFKNNKTFERLLNASVINRW